MDSVVFPVVLQRRLPSLEHVRAELARRRQSSQSQQSVLRYYDKPDGFALECVDWPIGSTVPSYELECLRIIQEKRRLAIRGPHGLGKTTILSLVVLWFALTRDAARQDWKCITTASAWRQLTKYLWPEIHKWTRRLKWERIGRPPFDSRTELLTLELKLRYGAAFAVASDVPDLIEGAHADQIAYLFDESKLIPSAVFDSAEGAFSAEHKPGQAAIAVAASTPGEPRGRFYEIHVRRPGYEDWSVRHVTCEEAIAAGRISRQWVEQRKKQWGETSQLFKNRVLGEFAESEADTLIPLSWVEAAVERWYAWKERAERGEDDAQSLTSLGIDLAWSESESANRTCFAHRKGFVIQHVDAFQGQSPMQSVGKAVNLLRARGGVAVVDVIGAAGVYSRLRELKVPALPFNASKHAVREVDGKKEWILDETGELRFANMRAAAWWRMRELLDPDNGYDVALPPDDEARGMTLLRELVVVKRRVTSDGRIQIQPKEQITAMLGQSPDCADAVVMAFALELLQSEETPWEMWTVDDLADTVSSSSVEEVVMSDGVYWPGGGT